MADLGKVIKGLDCCILRNPDDHARCSQCSYGGNCVNRLKMDALELLKSNEADIKALSEKYAELMDRTLEAAPVVECGWERMKDERDILCSVCGARFDPDIRFLTDSQIRFCPHCGAKVVKVKWT